MKTAQQYMIVKNTAIDGKKREYTDINGKKQENTLVENHRIPSAFLRKSVTQKINYAFAKPFEIYVENISDAPPEDDALKEEYLQHWNSFFTHANRKKVMQLVKSAIVNGIGWIYVNMDAYGKGLSLTNVRAETLYPQWEDEAHEHLGVIVRDYVVSEYSGGKLEEVKRVEFWDANTVERYIDNKGELITDTLAEGLQELPLATAHMVRPVANGESEALGWGRVPFVCFKSSDDELPLLNLIKENIDAYDKIHSKSTDGLSDNIDPLLVIEDVSPNLHRLQETRQMLKESRIVSLNGKAYYVKSDVDMNSYESKLERFKKDIHEFSSTVDTQDIRFGNNPSGISLEMLYQDLDIYTNGLQTEFYTFLEKLKYFIDISLEFQGKGSVEQWSNYRIGGTINRDTKINEESKIETTVKLIQTGVSQETVDEYNPAVKSHEVEEQRREAQRIAEQELEAQLQAKLGDDYKFPVVEGEDVTT
jgi:SPP1 family phage portal protein